jgi:anti-sigma factor RsiW
MRCGEATALISARLDGRLAPEAAHALDAHLAACAPCRGTLARLEAASAALRAAGPTAIPPFLAERAFTAATRAARPAPGAWFLPAARRTALAGAIAAAAVWAVALATGAASSGRADATQDPMEVAVLLWTAEGAR